MEISMTFVPAKLLETMSECKSILIPYSNTLSFSSPDVLVEDIDTAEGRASITTYARSVINEEVQFRAATRPQFSMPDSIQIILYGQNFTASCQQNQSINEVGKLIWGTFDLGM
ncbi:hypothetical protein LIER_34295 [Lithospermum erythrorhizon]|uniref:Uncharacterized protein n=1 Tax=Lithospermum erythrorhizon TaxID=34254 RepID=A0AAV3S2X6_LITER